MRIGNKVRGHDLTGKNFGNLIVIEMVKEFVGAGNQREYFCQCQCQNKTVIIVKSGALLSGAKDNCGCMTGMKISNGRKKYNKYDLSGKYGIGYTLKNEEFYFDLEDYNKIKRHCWFITSYRCSYVHTRDVDTGKQISLHRLVMDVDNSEDIIDHISGNTIDNRKSNLRIVDVVLNGMNRGESVRNTSGVRGVSFRKDNNKWRVRIREDGKEVTIGHFDILMDAAIARMNAEERVYGEYGRDDWEEKLRNISSSF